MSSASFPASAVLKACRAAGVEFHERGQSGGSDQIKFIDRVDMLTTLAEKVIENANQDLHATVSVSADDLVLIAKHLTFEGPMPLSAAT